LAPFGQAVSEEKIFLTVANQKKRIALGGHILNGANLGRKHQCKVLYKVSSFHSFGQQIWLPRAILVSDWLMLNKSYPLKLLGQIKLNLAGSIYARSSIKHLHLVPFGQQICPPRAILFFWTLHRCFLPSLAPFGQGVSEEKICLTVTNQKQELLLAAIFVGQTERNEETL
jgi:hypothetical protein